MRWTTRMRRGVGPQAPYNDPRNNQHDPQCANDRAPLTRKTTPAAPQAAAAVRTQRPDAPRDRKNGWLSRAPRRNCNPTECHTGGGGWHKASVSDCLPLAAPTGLSPLLILTLCGPERVLVVSTEPLDDLSCLTSPGVGCPGDGLLPVPLTRGIQMHTPSPCWVCRLQH